MTLLRRLYILLAAPILLVVIMFCSILEAVSVLFSEIKANTRHTFNKLKGVW